MSKDLRNIKLLERELEVKLSQVDFKRIMSTSENSLSYSIDKDKNVIGLNLSNFNLFNIPIAVFEFENIRRLTLSGNKLTSLPKNIKKLSKLEILSFINNDIKIIPIEILELKIPITTGGGRWLESVITFGENPIESPPIEIIDKGRKAILNYFNSSKGGTKSLNEVKVLLVGDGGCGKTSLQKLLVKEKFNPQESQTHGINIKHLKLRPINKNVTYRLWDFGGQEIMHATHQFFLSRRSIYIVLLNAREESNPEYWLNHIKSFGGNSPVLIAINKIDENPAYDVNRNFLKNKYPNIIDFVRVSCSEGVGISQVKALLRKAIIDIKNLNIEWPISWFEVKTHLESMTTNFINYDEFTNLCKRKGISNLSNQNTLVEYLNDLGIILHFKDFSLFDTHVLDPEWVTYAVYKIINSRMLAENYGILKMKEIRTIVKQKEENGKFIYPMGQLKYIIELMIKFELCYKISKEEILIPDLLPIQEPEFSIDNTKNILDVVISYSFLSKSIMPRLIVNLHSDIFENLMWRTGLVIYDENLKSTGLIKADYEKKEISISIVGVRRRDYLSIILFLLRRINKSFEGIEQKINIPLENGAKVSLSHLLRLESKGINTFLPDGLEQEINVKQMLGSIQSKQNNEEEIFAILDKLVNQSDNKESIAEKANDVIQLQPNFFGIGINLNALVQKYLQRK